MPSPTQEQIDKLLVNATKWNNIVNGALDATVVLDSHTVKTVTGYLYELKTYTLKGDWLTATAYVVKDIVKKEGAFYVALLSHTSGVFTTDEAADKWGLYQFRTADPFTFGNNLGVTGNLVVEGTINNIRIDLNTISSTSGNLDIVPVSGSAAILDGHWSFDGPVLTAITDNDTTINAYTGKAVIIEGISHAGGVLSTSSGNLKITPASGSAVILDATWSFDGRTLTGLADADLVINAASGRAVVVEGVSILDAVVTLGGIASTGDITINPDPGSHVLIDGCWSFDGQILRQTFNGDAYIQSQEGRTMFIGSHTGAAYLSVATSSTNTIGTLKSSGTTGATQFLIENGAGATFASILYAASYASGTVFSIGAGNAALYSAVTVGIGTTADVPLIFATNSAERIRITGAGKVGIGQTSPRSFLDVLTEGTENTPETSGSGVRIIANSTSITSRKGMLSLESNSDQAADTGASLVFTGRAIDSNDQSYVLGKIGGYKENSSNGNVSSYLAFATTSSAGDISEKLRITSAGDVGVGTSAPTRKVTVNVSSFNGISLEKTGFAHGITSKIETNTAAGLYMYGSSGGAYLIGVSGASAVSAMTFDAAFAFDPTLGIPGFLFTAGIKSGTTVTSVANTRTIFQIRNTATNLLTVLGDGTLVMRATSNLILGAGTAGTSALGVLCINNGTQGAAKVDAVQLVSADLTAGNTTLSIRTEGTGCLVAGVNAASLGAFAVVINGTVRYIPYSNTAPV